MPLLISLARRPRSRDTDFQPCSTPLPRLLPTGRTPLHSRQNACSALDYGYLRFKTSAEIEAILRGDSEAPRRDPDDERQQRAAPARSLAGLSRFYSRPALSGVDTIPIPGYNV